MKVIYRGFEIDAHREKCIAGYSLLYYSIFRSVDGWELTSGYEDSSDTPRTYINMFKERVDNYISHPMEEMYDWRVGDPVRCPYCGTKAPSMKEISSSHALSCGKCHHVGTEVHENLSLSVPCTCYNCLAPRKEKRLAKAVTA